MNKVKKCREISNYLFDIVQEGREPIPNSMANAKETFINRKEFKEGIEGNNVAVSFKNWGDMLFFLNMLCDKTYSDCIVNHWSHGNPIKPLAIIKEYKEEGIDPTKIKFIYSQGGLKDSHGITRRECDKATYQIWFRREYISSEYVTKEEIVKALIKYLQENNDWESHKIYLLWNADEEKVCVETHEEPQYDCFAIECIYAPDYNTHWVDFLRTKNYSTIFKNIWVIENYLKPFEYR